MSRTTTVRCEARRCVESTRLEFFDAEGWTVDTRGRDLCKRCSTGRCNGTIGPTDGQWSCSCLLPVDHDGLCKCSHDFDGQVRSGAVPASRPAAPTSPSLPTQEQP